MGRKIIRTKQMTVTEYAKLRGISQQAVSKALKLGHRTPGIINKKLFGVNRYLLDVDTNLVVKNKPVIFAK